MENYFPGELFSVGIDFRSIDFRSIDFRSIDFRSIDFRSPCVLVGDGKIGLQRER